MQGGSQGQVRSWVDWPGAGLLLLNMRGNRWCGKRRPRPQEQRHLLCGRSSGELPLYALPGEMTV